MKTKKEQNALKEKAEAESKEPRKLTEEDLEQVNGGGGYELGIELPTGVPGAQIVVTPFE